MTIRAIILLIFVILSVFAQAQENSNNGRFSISKKKGCNPLTITVNAPECTGNFSCSANFGTGTFISIVDGDTYTYDAPGNYTLTIVFSTTGNDQINLQITPNVQPEFDIYTCGGNGVQVKINDTNYDQYVVNFGDGTEVTTASKTANHTYGSSGNKNITVRGKNLNAEDNCNSLTKPVNVLSSLSPPVITQLTVLDNESIRLDFNNPLSNNNPNILYKLQFGVNSGTSFLPLRDVYNISSVVISNIKPDDNYYCFRLGTFDPCSNTVSYSNIICSANVDLTVQNNNNRLQWTTSEAGNLSNFSIYKNPGPIIGAPSSSREFNDGDVRCGTEYTYQLQSNYPNGSRSVSLLKSGTAISTDIPSAVNNVSAIVDGNNVLLQWEQDPDFTPETYSIFRSLNENFPSFATSPVPSFTDNTYDPQAGLCYKFEYDDVCGNRSQLSNAVCPMVLLGTLAGDNTINLSWTEYNGWADGVSNYVIEKYNVQGALIEAMDAGLSITFSEENDDFLNQVYIFKIIAYPKDGSAPSVSNAVMIIKNPRFSYPTAFTPNDDGLNDFFLVHSQYTAAFEMQIFNRWGELMFITDNPETGWDGTFRGNTQPEGAYVFKLKITDLAGRTFDRSGIVILLKKK